MNVNLNKLQSSLTGVLFTNVQSIKNTYQTLERAVQVVEMGDRGATHNYFIMTHSVSRLNSDINIYKMLTGVIDIKTVDLLPTTCNYDIRGDIVKMGQFIKQVEEKYIYVKPN